MAAGNGDGVGELVALAKRAEIVLVANDVGGCGGGRGSRGGRGGKGGRDGAG